PAADCGCGIELQPTAQSLPGTVPTAAGITDDCYCPQFIETFLAGDNYWVVYKHPPNSGMETECSIWEEVVIYDTLMYGECDSQCSSPNCWLSAFFLRKVQDEEGEEEKSQDAEAEKDTERPESMSRLPSLRLPNKKRVQDGRPDFEFPVKLNAHIDFREESIRPRLVKITGGDGEVFTWLQLIDLQPKEEGRRIHRVGHEIEAPEGNAEAETVGIDKLQPVTLDPASRNFPGAVVDGYYRLALGYEEDEAQTDDGEKVNQPKVYFVRMHSLLPSEEEKRELLPKPTIAVEPERE
ncbi:MAG: hypothetical protein WBC44_20305, partial [Planctomycetaceae bacterium]